MKKISCTLGILLSFLTTSAMSQDKKQVTVKKIPLIKAIVKSSTIKFTKVVPISNSSLKGSTKLNSEKWQKAEFKFILQGGSPKNPWIDELELSWKVIVPRVESEKRFPILLKKKVLFSNVRINNRNEITTNIFMSPSVYERYIKMSKIDTSDLSFLIEMKADGVVIPINLKPYFVGSAGGDVIPKNYWGIPESKFLPIKNKETFFLSKDETPFIYDSVDQFLTIKKQVK